MLLGHRIENPKPLIMVGMAFLALAAAWPRFAQLTLSLGEGWLDAVRGGLYGVSFGLLLWAARLGGLRRRGT